MASHSRDLSPPRGSARESQLTPPDILERLAEAPVDWSPILAALPQVDESALRKALREAAICMRPADQLSAPSRPATSKTPPVKPSTSKTPPAKPATSKTPPAKPPTSKIGRPAKPATASSGPAKPPTSKSGLAKPITAKPAAAKASAAASRKKSGYSDFDWSEKELGEIEPVEIAAEERARYGKAPFVIRGNDGGDFVLLRLEPVRSIKKIPQIIAHIDGCCKGNPGPSACGVVFLAPGGELLAEGCAYLGEMTNNAAEYHALIAALLQALEWGNEQLVVFSDSELLVKQLNGEYRVRSPQLYPLIQAAQDIRRQFSYCAIRHVPRERNERADQLANEAIRRYKRH